MALECLQRKLREGRAKEDEPATSMAATRLPSPSPANAAWSLERLVEAYRPLAEAVRE